MFRLASLSNVLRARFTQTSSRKLSRCFSSQVPFVLSLEVEDALRTRRPVVALESTIYTHGFPYPENVALALALEAVVYENGGVPATIAVVEGKAHVGLTPDELTRITTSADDPTTMKVSRRDLPYILGLGIAGKKLNGGTTVAGTMILAQAAGIKVFGTGGLGGVHRGGQDSMDISADLTELGRTNVAVVSSGCKSFLDIPRTLEYLETQGAGVFTFADGRTGDIDFPAFWTRDSGIKSPMVVQNERDAAAMIYSQNPFPNPSGLLFANPIPEEFSIPKAKIDIAIEQAVQEAADQGFHGHRNTPFILARIKELTKGNSLPANEALIKSNVARATRIAVEYETLRKQFDGSVGSDVKVSVPGNFITRHISSTPAAKSHQATKVAPVNSPAILELNNTDSTPASVDVVVAGSVAIDLSCNYSSSREGKTKGHEVFPQMHTSNIASMTRSIGGVGHNVALAVHRAGGNLSVRLQTVIADDSPGKLVLEKMASEGLSIAGVRRLPAMDKDGNSLNSTAEYVAVNDAKKDLVIAMADMSILTNVHEDSFINFMAGSPKWVVVDGNWTARTIRHLSTTAKAAGAKVIFEPVSTVKATGLIEPVGRETLHLFPHNKVDMASPNQYELEAMHAAAKKHELFESERWWTIIDSLGIPSTGARDRFVALAGAKLTDMGIPVETIQLLPFIPTLLTKLGSEGVLLTELLKPQDPRLTDPDAAPYILSRCNNGSTEVGGVYMRLFPALKLTTDVVSVNGVGDTFLGVLIAGLAKGLPLDEKLINVAQRGAVLTLGSVEAVSPELSILSDALDALPKLA
ncbi:IdgA domain-containing protein [Phlyctema vagabunda]|uniref:IdgA domain-containing protein n=1 Tax=Phlyctema vagabunda TaxID=108571 RepID=A0ABR4P7C7_9HELO